MYTEEKTKVAAAVWGTVFIQFLAALAIYTEEKAKVVASVWGTEFIPFLGILRQDDTKNGMHCKRMI